MYKYIRSVLVSLLLCNVWLYALPKSSENLGKFNEARVQDLSQFQGLSSSKIISLLKDQKGFVWIGTDNGLNRYDGNSILVFQNDPDNPHSIGNNNIQALLEDRHGKLWIGTKAGLYLFDPVTQKFTGKPIPGSPAIFISSICEDLEGKIWIASNKGLYKFSFETNSFQQIDFLEQNVEINNLGIELHTDKNGELWIGTWGMGIFRMNPITGEYVRFSTPSLAGHDIYDIGKVTDIEEGTDGSLWVGGWSIGLLRIYPDRKSAELYSHAFDDANTVNGNKIKALKFDEQGYLWIGIEESGLDRFAPETETFTHFLNDFQRTDIYEGPSIYSIMIDDQSLMWLGFRNDGVKIVPLKKTPFSIFEKENDDTGIFSICETAQGIFVGSRGAIDFFDAEKQKFQTYPLPNNETPIALYDCQDRTILVGTYRGSMFKFDPLQKTYRNLTNSQVMEYLGGSKIECFYKLNEKEILIGSQRGLFRVDLITNEYKRIVDTWIYDLIPGDNENIWAMSWNSFHQYFPQTGKLISHESNVQGDMKTSYFTPDNKTLYLGTDLGFFVQDINSQKTQRFHDIFPFINNQANAMAVDNQSNFWITSETGLIYYSPAKNKFRTFGQEDGLPSIRFYDGVGTKLKNGQIAFGGDNGLMIFDPLKIEDGENDATLTFTGLSILNENIRTNEQDEILDRDISEISELRLKYRQNIITFDFALLSYINPDKHRYRYHLAGFNDEWFDIGNQNSITFTNLDPGDYKLSIQAANEENNWGPVTSMAIHVSPPIYQTWYAYIFYGIVAISVFLMIRQFYANRQKLESRLKDEHMNFEKMKAKAMHESEFSQMRLKFFTNISHEFRTPLTLILGPLENFIKNRKWPSEDHLALMHKNAERLQRLINQILDFRSMESKSLKFEPSWGNVTQFAKETAQLFVPLAQQKGLQFILNDNTKELNAWFDRDKVEKIIYNLLSNAHKHTQKGKIEFTINTLSREMLKYKSSKWQSKAYSVFLEMIIKDSGEGIPKDKLKHIFDRFYHLQSDNSSVQGTGIGLSLTKELLAIHNGKIFVNSELNIGSEFKVIIPLTIENSPNEERVSEPIEDEGNIYLNVIEYDDETGEKTEEKLPTILIVEDNEDLRKYMRVEFGTKYNLIEADDGENGLEKALKEIPDLIISDLMMPKMDGIEFCKAIKKDQRTSHIPIIILTAHTSQFNKVRGYEIGADDYITKPFSSELLALRVENLLKGRKELQSKFSREVRLEPKDLQISSMDERFLNKAMEVVEENLNDSEFNADAFASEMCMSRVHLYRKLKALTDQSVSDFVKTARLKLAANLIGQNKLTIKEAAYTVGFKDPKYFSKCFKQQFGVKPSEYVIDDEPADSAS